MVPLIDTLYSVEVTDSESEKSQKKRGVLADTAFESSIRKFQTNNVRSS